MNEQELLAAISQMIDKKLELIRDENKETSDNLTSQIMGVRVLLDTEIRREINLLSEGQSTILDRLPDADDIDTMDARLSAVEAVVRKHSKDIQNLKKAQ